MIDTHQIPLLAEIYPSDQLGKQYNRYNLLYTQFLSKFKSRQVHIFSVPGRSELSGNHTDHNHGKVLACSINLDSIAAASKNDSNIVTLYSSLYEEPFQVNLGRKGVNEREKGTTSALIRGIAAELNTYGFITGGFDCYMMSDVLIGSGLSSSASVEILIGSIFNHLYNDGKIDTITLAKCGQFAENVYMGKPCGLMDQVACAEGGIVAIDFKDPQNPLVRKIEFDINQYNYNLLVVDTGGNHADLTEDYASIPREMKIVKLTPPNRIFELNKGLLLNCCNDTVEVFYPGAGHSPDNVVVYLRNSKILFAGCIVKSLDSKSLGNLGDADLTAWPESVKEIIRKFPDAQVVIPGHGEAGDTKLLHHTLELLKHQGK